MAALLARPAAWRPHAWRAGRLAVTLALGLLAAGAAEAVRLVDVRVGRHREFVRVVFETDAPAAFSIEPGEQPGERRVRIEAGGAPAGLRVPADAGAEVTLEPLADGATLARVRAAVPVRIESQVLDRPPRIVVDLRPGAEMELAPGPEAGRPLPAPARSEEAAGSPGHRESSEPSEPPEPLLAPALREPALFPELAPPLAEEPAPEAPESPPAGAPAVSAPPPAVIAPRLDDRSLVVGAAAGAVVGLGLSLLARGRGRRGEPRVEAPEPPAPAPEPETESDAPPVPEAWPLAAPPPVATGRPGDLGLDLLRMLQRVDERLAAVEEALASLAARTGQLELRGGTQAEELTAQRVALARLQLALTPPGGSRAGPGVRRGPTAGSAPPPPRES